MSITVNRAILQQVILCAVLAVIIAAFGGCASNNRSLRGGSQNLNAKVNLNLVEKNDARKKNESEESAKGGGKATEETAFIFVEQVSADIDGTCSGKNDCSHEQITYTSPICGSKGIAIECPGNADLFIVEFDDSGRLYHREQMENFFKFLNDELSPKDKDDCKDQSPKSKEDTTECFNDVSLIVAVHGWRHNASFEDRNLRELREALFNALMFEQPPGKKKTEHLNPSNRPRKVVGLYVGWRGSVWSNEESLPWPLSYLPLLSFWDRKSAAMDVALGATRELFARLGHLRAEVNKEIDNENTKDTRKRLGRESGWYERCTERAEENHSKCRPMRVLIVGHSFGSLVIYNSISESIIEHVAEGLDVRHSPNCEQTVAPVSSPHADLIVLVNPAFEGTRFEPLYQASLNRIQKSCYQKTQAPVLVMITGTTDTATGSAFPTVRFLSSLFENTSPRDKDSTVIKNLEREETAATRQTVGHNPRYMTHYLDIFPDTDIPNLDRMATYCLTTDWYKFTRSSTDRSSSEGSGTETVPLEREVDAVAQEWRDKQEKEPWAARAMCGGLRLSPASKEPVVEGEEKDPLEDLPARSESSGPWKNQLRIEPDNKTRDPHNPIWIVRTKDDRIINEHNGYLNSKMVGFILQLYRDVLQGNSPSKQVQAK